MRTRAVRLLLATALLGVLAAFFFLAGGINARPGGFLPAGTTGIVALDLSNSIRPAANRRIARVLREFARSNRPAGLVLFSDTAYEALPPGTRGANLRPLVRFFVPRARAGRSGRFLVNPWTPSFRGGTRISAGLRLVRKLIREQHIRRPSVLLVSDLDYAPNDLWPLTETLNRYRTEDIPLRVVPLFPDREDLHFFSRVVGEHSVVAWNELRVARGRATREEALTGSAPAWLAVAGAGLLLLLGVNELLCGRLALARGGTA